MLLPHLEYGHRYLLLFFRFFVHMKDSVAGILVDNRIVEIMIFVHIMLCGSNWGFISF